MALNVSIEAARVGDADKGFEVVAEEMNELSNQTKEAFESVEQIIQNSKKKPTK